MPHFVLERTLPSTKVTKILLLKLEEFLIDQAVQLTALPKEKIKEDISIEIVDSFGTETLDSIKEFKSERFPDSIKEVLFGLSVSRGLRFGINFKKDRFDSKIRLSHMAPDAREKMFGVYSGIFRLLEEHKTWSWVFHPHIFYDLFAPWLFLSILIILLFALFRAPDIEARIVYAVPTFLIMILAIGWILRPYTAFDSRRQDTLNSAWKWFSLGTLGFLLFGTLFPVVRKFVMGF